MSGCGCGCGSKGMGAVSESKLILEALAKCEAPCGTKDVAAATGLDKDVVSKQIAVLKKQGLVDSPVRCKIGITPAGRASI